MRREVNLFDDHREDRNALWLIRCKAVTAALLMGWLMILAGCSSNTIEGPESSPDQPIEAVKQVGPATTEDTFRAWIRSVRLAPALPVKDQVLSATVDWQPQGQPGITTVYNWFVNGERVSAGKNPKFPLSNFNSGNRVYVIAELQGKDGHILDSKRSLSVVIQNRPPQLDSGLEGLVQKGQELVGQIRFSDPDGDPVVIKLLQGPPGLMVAEDGKVHWPLSEVKAGEHELTLELEDIRGLGFRGTLSFSMGKGIS